MEADQNGDWQWEPGEHGFHFHIPPHERVPPAPSADIPGRYVPWESEFGNHWVPDLTGCTLEEVQREAARIHLGDTFTSIEEFDRCLDSWCVLNGRRATKIKTQRRYALRVCQFGGRVRPLWRHNQDGRDQATAVHANVQPVQPEVPTPCSIPPPTQAHSSSVLHGFRGPVNLPSQGQESAQSEPFSIVGGVHFGSAFGEDCSQTENCSLNTHADSQNEQFSCSPSQVSCPPTTHRFSEPPVLGCRAKNTGGGAENCSVHIRQAGGLSTGSYRNTGSSFGNCSVVQPQPTAWRQPLGELDLNAEVFDGHNLRSQTSSIRNRREWIPNTIDSVRAEGGTRSTSRTGACGQHGRMLPPATDAANDLHY